ncbi:phosphopantetheine-binding protein, partial [Pseudoalteromonas sp. OOF1S-7]|uniref:phosphopantetheine-binding protein n=1 Tax=Pseudoalteromonas sp. OOF1S-7 TaxID=2917757 RepID=UPI001EF510BC
IRGFRVELGEIAQQLSRQTQVDSALVLAKNGPAGTYLVAYVQSAEAVTEQSQPEFMAQTLATLAQTLPDYMVPKLGVVIDEWPLTANGKVNKKALPEADSSMLQETYVAPENDIEQTLCEIWSQLLGIAHQDISTQSHFFDLGGHSLLVVKLATQVRETFDIEFSIQALYDATRICDQAVHIEYLQFKSNRDEHTEACEELEW